MNFLINESPPGKEEIDLERESIKIELKQIKTKDTIVTSILIIASSVIIGFAVYWYTNNIHYSAIAATIFPLIGIVMSMTGIITMTGFRSAASSINELNYNLVALKPISKESSDDILELSHSYGEVDSYRKQVAELGRELVNGELAMFWEWDASTQAKIQKGKLRVGQAKQSMSA